MPEARASAQIAQIDEAIGRQTPKAARAAQAQALLDNPLLGEAFSEVKARIMEAFERVALDPGHVHAGDDYEVLAMRLRCANEVEAVLLRHIENGKLARKEIERLQQRRRRADAIRGA